MPAPVKSISTYDGVIRDPIVNVPEHILYAQIKPLDVQPLPELAKWVAPTVTPRAPIPGNWYADGNCTWYVKDKRADLPNDLGDAHSWYASAQAYGLPTGVDPWIGAVGVSFDGSLGHVVYVEAVNDDGTIVISEMNYGGLYNTNTRTVPASDFVYIY